MPSALGVGLWILQRLGRVVLVQPWLLLVGSKIWNLGVLVGFGGILYGHGTSFEFLDMPGYAAWIMVLGYLMMAICGLLTFHYRTERTLYASQWFIVAALFWFPWVFSTAQLLAVAFPVRGIAQAAIWWWYQANFLTVFFSLAGLAIIFYFVPKLANVELSSRYLALYIFWLIILFGGWVGVPNSAPLPAWMPAISTITSVIMILPVIAVAMCVHQTVGSCLKLLTGPTALRFLGVGTASFVLTGVIKAAAAVAAVHYPIGFTWLTPALAQLNYNGFVAMVVFGGVYTIVPALMGPDLLCPKLARAHYWLALLGIIFSVVPLVVGGVLQAGNLNNPSVPFVNIIKGTLHFLRATTLGDLFFAVGVLLFIVNLIRVAVKFYRPKAQAVYGVATAPLFEAEVNP